MVVVLPPQFKGTFIYNKTIIREKRTKLVVFILYAQLAPVPPVAIAIQRPSFSFKWPGWLCEKLVISSPALDRRSGNKSSRNPSVLTIS